MAGLRLRPEREALLPALAVGAIGAAAVVYNANAVWLVLCVVVAAVAAGAAATCRRLRGLRVHGLSPHALTAGQAATVPVRIDSAVAIPGLVIESEVRNNFRTDATDATETTSAGRLNLSAGRVVLSAVRLPAVVVGGQQVLVPIAALPRGIHELSVVRVATAYPLGVVRCEVAHVVAVELVVAPRPLGIALPSIGDQPSGVGSGGLAADFAGHRPYRAGDPIHGLDWRAMARGHGAHSTLWDGAGAGVAQLRWDDCSGEIEQRLEQLARWLSDAHAGNVRFSLELPGTALAADQGDRHLQRCLRALAAFPGSSTPASSAPAQS